LAAGAKRPIHVDLFPARMTGASWDWLRRQGSAETVRFWSILRKGYTHFERTRTIPKVTIRSGEYVVG